MRPHPHGPASPDSHGFHYRGLAHYRVCLRTTDDACRLGSATAQAMRLTRFGLVVRHYAHQLPHKFLDLDVPALAVAPAAVHMVVRLRGAPGAMPAPDPQRLRRAVHWLKALTTHARHRGVLDGRWLELGGPVWAAGYERKLLRRLADVRHATAEVQALGARTA